MIVARTIKGYGATETANVEGKHGQPLKDPDKAIEELGNVGPVHVDVAKPESTGTPHGFDADPSVAAAHLRARRRRGPDPQGVRPGPGRGHAPSRRRRRASTARSATPPTSRRCSRTTPERYFEVYIAEQMMMADRRRLPGPRLDAVRVDVRRVPLARL